MMPRCLPLVAEELAKESPRTAAHILAVQDDVDDGEDEDDDGGISFK